MSKSMYGIVAVVIALTVVPAHAYVGPGAGLTLIGSAIGLLLALFAALGAILWWPIRRLLSRAKKVENAEVKSPVEGTAS